MSLTLLALIQEHCRRQALLVPTVVMSSQDDQLLQLVGGLNEILDDLLDRREWAELQREATFTSVASEDQGALTTLAPLGFKHIINETIFDRTSRLPLFGPRNASQWQGYKALPTTGPYYKYRIRGGHILVNPAMPADHSMAFEYMSSWSVVDGVNIAQPYKQYFSLDEDTCLFPDKFLILGLRWWWKKEKGFRYAEDFRFYETAVAEAAGHDGSKPQLSLNGDCGGVGTQPGVFVPYGSWSV